MRRKPQQAEVKRIESDEPLDAQEHNQLTSSRPSAPPGFYYHPQDGNLVPARDHDSRELAAGSEGGFQAAPGENLQTGESDYVLEGKHRIRTNADGSTTTAFEGRVYRHDAPQQAAHDDIPMATSKRKIAIRVGIVALVIWISAEIFGLPHVRTEPGVYAGVEGIKTIDSIDAPVVILKRLDRPVFMHLADGVGWCIGAFVDPKP